MAGRGDETAYAANWRAVLAADAVVGAVPLVVGSVLFVIGRTGWGVASAAAGAAYVILVGRRAIRWRRLRADAGL